MLDRYQMTNELNTLSAIEIVHRDGLVFDVVQSLSGDRR